MIDYIIIAYLVITYVCNYFLIRYFTIEEGGPNGVELILFVVLLLSPISIYASIIGGISVGHISTGWLGKIWLIPEDKDK